MIEKKISHSLQDDFNISQVLVWTFIAGTMILYFVTAYSMEGGDIANYLLKWCRYYENHNFLQTYDDIAAQGRMINYPPVFPAWLYLIHPAVNHLMDIGQELSAQFLIRIPTQILHFVILVYFVVRKEYRWLIFWGLNPWWFAITAMYGQTDEWFCFLVLMLIWNVENKNLYAADLCFVLAALWKTQGIVLVVPYFFGLRLYEPSVKNRLRHIMLVICIGYLFYLLFSIYNKNFLYPASWYLTTGTSNDVSEYDGNILGLAGSLARWSGFRMLNAALLKLNFILILLIIVFAWQYMKKTKKYVETVFLFLLLFQQFTMRQLYRYTVYPAVVLTYLIFMHRLWNQKIARCGKLFAGTGLMLFLLEIPAAWFPKQMLVISRMGICLLFVLTAIIAHAMRKEANLNAEDKSMA